MIKTTSTPSAFWPRSITSAVVLSALSLMLTACGDDRSPQAFCDTFQTQATKLHSKYESADQSIQNDNGSGLGMLTGMAALMQSPGDMVVMFSAMDKHAPNDIEPSVAEIIDSLKQEQQAMGSGSLLGMFAGGLAASLSSGGAWQDVDTYIKDHCDLSFEK